MNKQLIAFDLDDTLAVTKSPISDTMGELLVKLLEKYEVCIISGGNYHQFMIQVVDRLEAPVHSLNRLHLMPTCGTQYYRYNELDETWKRQYFDELKAADKKEIISILEETAKLHKIWPENPYGEVIEDRGSQITYASIGQQAPSEEKYAWNAKYEDKKKALRDAVAEKLPEFEVRLGGTTSIDITHIGIDKAYGMQKLIEALDINKSDILFIGDKLQEGGNDYPVKAMGIDTIEVEKWEDTAFVLKGVLGVTE